VLFFSSRSAKKREKHLTRAASVPTRSDDPPAVVPPVASTSLRDPCDAPPVVELPPSPMMPLELVPPPPFPVESSASPTATSPSGQQMLKNRNGTVVLPNLPGIQPIGD
jgi:hypothetical protein